jgi:hypothetical protein
MSGNQGSMDYVGLLHLDHLARELGFGAVE